MQIKHNISQVSPSPQAPSKSDPVSASSLDVGLPHEACHLSTKQLEDLMDDDCNGNLTTIQAK